MNKKVENKMEFSEWLKQVIPQECDRLGISETQLALNIGVSQSLLNAYRLNNRNIPKTKRIIDAFTNYFGGSHPEIYEIFDIPKPKEVTYSVLVDAGFPEDFSREIIAARHEYTEELESKGISNFSPEAREIIKAAFARHGIHLTDTK